MSPELETIEGIIAERGIDEVLHFTTNKGLLGILATRNVKSRALLSEDKYLEHIFTPNAGTRKDSAWVAYVNLSITRINTEYFGHSERWHRNEKIWWCVASLDPVILSHSGVVFATTNNIYSGVSRSEGATGLAALFAERVVRWSGNVVARSEDCPAGAPTCVQAEVLYPEMVSTQHLRRVYVATRHHKAVVKAQMASVRHPEVEVVVRPDVFR